MKNSLGAETIVPTTPVWVVGTYNRDGKPNVMTAAWGGICCSKATMRLCIPEKSHAYLQ